MSNWWNISGKVWLLADNVDTDQILPGYALMAPRHDLKRYALAGSQYPDFPDRVRTGEIIVAGRNFGCGSSREQAPVALKEAGIALVVACSVARIFRRNCINIGLPVLVADLVDKVQQGDEIVADLKQAQIIVTRTGAAVMGQELSGSIFETLSCGGLINKARADLGLGK
jgi:3-isopropylmalate dehydratase small subunit